MKETEVVIAKFPQSNGSLKRRPALILREMPPFNDFLICGISTQLRQKVDNFDETISSTDEDFDESGLDSDSLIRLGFLLVLPRNEIIGSIGSISNEKQKDLVPVFGSEGVVSEILNGKRKITLKTAKKSQEFFGLTTYKFFI